MLALQIAEAQELQPVRSLVLTSSYVAMSLVVRMAAFVPCVVLSCVRNDHAELCVSSVTFKHGGGREAGPFIGMLDSQEDTAAARPALVLFQLRICAHFSCV